MFQQHLTLLKPFAAGHFQRFMLGVEQKRHLFYDTIIPPTLNIAAGLLHSRTGGPDLGVS